MERQKVVAHLRKVLKIRAFKYLCRGCDVVEAAELAPQAGEQITMSGVSDGVLKRNERNKER